MGIESKQFQPNVQTTLDDMSYTALDNIYPSSTPVRVGSYKAFLGGVSGCWTVFNKDTSPHRVDDSEIFAFFSNTKAANDENSSWKIHLSIHPNDLRRAWDLVYPILMKHEVPCFKTTRNSVSQAMYTAMSKTDPSTNSLTVAEQEQALRDIIRVSNGMQITVYIPVGMELAYNNLLEQIEPILYQAGIRPGVIDKSDRALGIYSSVRNEGIKYTSHDKVSGYKVAALQDPFYAIDVEWDNVEINWGGLDYERHLHKVKGLILQMLDAEKEYEKGVHSDFEQIYDVAMEYFKRWKTLLKKTAPKDLGKLAARDQAGFLELKEWVDEGYNFLPPIKKHNEKKVKKAVGLLARKPQVSTLSIKPVHVLKRANAQFDLMDDASVRKQVDSVEPGAEPNKPIHGLKRTNAQLDLNEEVVGESQVDVVEPVEEPKLVKRGLSAKTLHELNIFRKESFKDPVLGISLEEVSTELEVSSTSESATRVFWGMFNGLLMGATLGLALSVAFAPWALVICLSLSASGIALGGVIAHYTTPSNQEAEEQPLIQKKQVESKEEQVTAPHKASKSLGFFAKDVRSEYEQQEDLQPTTDLDFVV